MKEAQPYNRTFKLFIGLSIACLARLSKPLCSYVILFYAHGGDGLCNLVLRPLIVLTSHKLC